MGNYIQGRFVPLNPQKYKGDPTNIIFRSSWELLFFKYLDKNPAVEWWASEETVVLYVNPFDGKIHRYFIDITVSINGQIYLIEIKPENKTKPPKPPKRKGKHSLQRLQEQAMEWEINQKKWEAAESLAKKKGWKFLIMTEKDLRALGFKL